MTINPQSVAKMIDHTCLAGVASRREIARLCEEAKAYGFATVCINPCYVSFAASLLAGTTIGVSTVVGFPLGATTPAVKAFEAGEALQNGATEIDMVINIAALKERRARYVADEIARVRACIQRAVLKVILETTLLSEEEKLLAARLAREAGADMLKTSTGTAGGATLSDVRFLKEAAPSLGIKASGGIRDAAFAIDLIAAGAVRLGTSSAVKIMNELGGQVKA